jgi:hypothetical protein
MNDEVYDRECPSKDAQGRAAECWVCDTLNSNHRPRVVAVDFIIDTKIKAIATIWDPSAVIMMHGPIRK